MVQWLIKKTVHEALTDSRWIQDIQGAIIVAVLIEYLRLQGLISEVVVQLDREREREDSYLAASGSYSTKFAYEDFFIGAIHFRPRERIQKGWAPNK